MVVILLQPNRQRNSYEGVDDNWYSKRGSDNYEAETKLWWVETNKGDWDSGTHNNNNVTLEVNINAQNISTKGKQDQ